MKIYVMFSCNAQKQYTSMTLLGATTDLKEIKYKLADMLEKDLVEFNMGEFNPNDLWDVYNLNVNFEFVYIEELVDGEFI